MIRPCTQVDTATILDIVNDGARAYEGVIPADRWHDPYMSLDYLLNEIASGVTFWGYEKDGQLAGVMGIQPVQDVLLIRHAYVRTTSQNSGIGARLLEHLKQQATCTLLVGTWANATWAIRFYERHGFQIAHPTTKNLLLRKYWSIPERQIETSVVLSLAPAAPLSRVVIPEE
jgi:N-acetylglutamate synthase-like GNAT family acetyltransferase